MLCIAGSPKNNGPVLLKWDFYHTEPTNKCVWLRMARMEMDSNLKTSGRFFQVFTRLVSQIKSFKTHFELTQGPQESNLSAIPNFYRAKRSCWRKILNGLSIRDHSSVYEWSGNIIF